MLKFKTTIFILSTFVCFCCLLSCESLQKEIKYNFNHDSQIDQVEDNACFDGYGHKIFGKVGTYFNQLTNEQISSISNEVLENSKLKTLKSLEAKYKFINDYRTLKLKVLFYRIVKHTKRKDISYNIYLIQPKDGSKFYNAMSSIGGNLFVSTDLYDSVSTKELAFIIGHELGHLECYHQDTMLKKHVLLSELLGSFDGEIAHLLFSLLSIPFDQSQEFQADRSGAYLTYMAGFDPSGALDLFFKWDQTESDWFIKNFTATHFRSEDRFNCISWHLNKCKVRK